MIHTRKTYDRNRGSLSRLPAMVLYTFLAFTFQAHNLMAAEPLKIVVYGASGHIGTRIATEALSRGHDVTGVSRDAGRLQGKIPGLNAVQGSILDIDSVVGIVRGKDIVINVIGDDSTNKDPKQHPVVRSAHALVAALRQLGDNAPRLIAVIGAATLEVKPGVLLFDTMDLKPGTAPMILITGHKIAYDFYHANTDVPWTIASPSRHIEAGERTGKFRISGTEILRDEKGELTNISYEDFAVAIIDEAEQGKYIRKQFTAGY